MNLSPTSDDKIEALVGLVLQAVDQRLTTVREQLVDLTNTVSRRHADLRDQIAECREMISSAADGSGSATLRAVDGAAPGADAASAQVLQAANMLTERVTFLESRVNQYTDDRVAELRSAFEQLPVATPLPGVVKRLPPLPPSVAKVEPPAATPSRSTAVPTAPTGALAAAAPSAPSPVPRPAIEPAPAAAAEFDLDAFSAKLNARLSALVERAIAT